MNAFIFYFEHITGSNWKNKTKNMKPFLLLFSSELVDQGIETVFITTYSHIPHVCSHFPRNICTVYI